MKRFGTAAFAVALISALLPARAVSPANPHRAPLYWSPYEYNFRADGAIPEKEWAANIDWVERNLKPYGYTMVCIDGWGDDSRYNKDGYRTTHSSEWRHDYAWWSANLRSRGMTLGIYNNPLWIIKTAADAGVKIKGTDIPLKSIMNEGENARWFKWVQVDRPGAEQYVKGYIQYYADMGVRYLRVDFLSWFEDGQDRNAGVVGIKRPRAQYETALRWMREACDANGMMLSLVMPHLHDEADLEARYGHMFRVNDDAGNGQWQRFSDERRGVRLPGWSQYANAMDGLTYWSYLAGRNRVILDPDFLRLNTFANDDEKRSVISACLMAGAPVTVADRYNTIRDGLWAYRNEEMLALNRDGFVGKPLTNDPTKEASQVWKGRMSNGDWVVGFFNREGTPRVRQISFSSMGFRAGAWVRDLWRHENLGLKASYSAKVPPHGCTVIRISSKRPTSASSPRFSLRGGTYTFARTVALSCNTPGAAIRFTLDGSKPTASSLLYRRPLRISRTATVSAVSRAKGLSDSPVAAETYSIRPSGPLPGPWLTADIGAVKSTGAASFAGGSFAVTGSGADIEGAADAFRFVYRPVSGDITLTARVDSLSPTNPWAKAGLMLREGLGAGARNALVAVTHSYGVTAQHRDAVGGGTSTSVASLPSAPVWLRLTRKGDSISCFHSADGVDWAQIGVTATVTMQAPVYAGLEFTSHADGTLGTAEFSSVTLLTNTPGDNR